MNKLKDTDIQAAIGWILRTGVLLSTGIVVFGAVIYIYRHGYDVTDYRTFKGVPDFVKPSGVIGGILAFKGKAIIQSGIILLIATPVIRVACSAIGFILEKDHLYTFITLLVLAVIFVSMLTGHAG